MTLSHSQHPTLEPEDDDRRVVRAGAELLEVAAARLVSPPDRVSLEAGRRFLQYADRNQICVDQMWVMLDDRGGIRSAVLAVPSAGRTTMFFAGRVSGHEASDATARVLRRVCGVVAETGVKLAQALLEPRERGEQATFLSAGFHVLASLSYLERPVRPLAGFDRAVPGDVTLESWEVSRRGAFLEALDASYQGTLDCPGLSGLRSTDDILEGHRATGRFVPELWTLLRLGGRPAGVLLLNPSLSQNAVELVYVGLAQWARGRGLGRLLLARVFDQVGARAEQSVTLAVDERNAPALHLYFRAGFRRLLRRVALIRPLNSA